MRTARKTAAAITASLIIATTAGAGWAHASSADSEGARSAGDASVFVPITPCRIVDTRSGGGGLFRPGDQRSYQVYGSGPAFASQGGKTNGCAIGDDAIAVEATVSATGPTSSGYLRAWPTGAPTPNATFLNYTAQQSITNTGAIALSDTETNDLTLRNYSGSTQVVIDIQGYYANIGQP